ncbi:MAG: N-acetylglutamate synthase [Chloroflexota bacterium]|jgi:ribosomal protein S18 acetylase RimI-like enzyme|nr:N-acetylglutamate synthase [Chloroflexota bacterium]
MGELRPATPPQRPETARPRSEPDPTVAPPSGEEVHGIARHLATLAVHSGATARDDAELRALLVRSPGDGIALNYAALPRWDAGASTDRLGHVADRLRALGEWPSLLIAEVDDAPAGLSEQLPAAGWTPVGRETVLWVGAASVVPHLDPSLRIEAVQPRSVDDHQDLEAAVFGLGKREGTARRRAFAMALQGGDLRAYVVRINGEPVAVARVSVGPKDAGLYGIGVAEAWRNRGVGTLLTTVATRAGMALGKRIVWLSVEDTNDGARRMYERLGFRQLFRWGRWVTRDR